MKTALRASILAVAGLVLFRPAAVCGQELFVVTATSRAGSAGLEPQEGAPLDLTAGRSITPGVIRVGEDARLMLFEPSGVVVVVLGPATLEVRRDELTSGVQVELRNGKAMFAAARPADEGAPLVLLAQAAADPRTDVEVPIENGHTAVAKSERGLTIAYATHEPGRSIAPRLNGSPVSLPSGQLMTIAANASPEIAPVGDWAAKQGFAVVWGRELGVASAQAARREVEDKLFGNITAWDRYAGGTYVATRLYERTFNPEIRQTVQSITTPTSTSTRGGTVQTTGFPGANAVPVISPAASSVQDPRSVGAGVTAIGLNTRAAELLASSGSQGLGFQGLRSLAIPGIREGLRTAGPAGLGAQP